MHQFSAIPGPSSLYLRAPYVPKVLREQDRWLPTRMVKGKKVPLSPSGRPCNPHDPSNRQSFEEATRPYFQERRGVHGLAFALDGSGYAAIDLDGVVDDLGRVTDPHALALLGSFASYTELSPSGRGLHIWLDAVLPDGNRHLPGLDVLGSGIITMTGHPIQSGSIVSGSTPWDRLLAGLPPPRARGDPTLALPASLPVPTNAECEAVLARAKPNAGFRKLMAGDWRDDYPSRSEADAALAVHLRRNGADLSVIVALLKASGLPRSSRRDDSYLVRTAMFALTVANVRVSQWSGIAVPDPALERENHRRRTLVAQLEAHPALVGREAAVLHRLAAEIASRRDRGEAPDSEGFYRVSPQTLSDDHPGLPTSARLMTRRGCLKALRRLADAGVIELRKGEDCISWHDSQRTHSRVGAITRIHVAGSDFVSIITGFLHRLDGRTTATPQHPVYVTLLGTQFQSVPFRTVRVREYAAAYAAFRMAA